MTRPLPVYFRDRVYSCLGTMLFPDDPAKAESYVALRINWEPAEGEGSHLSCFVDAGGEWTVEMSRRHAYVLGQNALSRDEIDAANMAGGHIGEVVKHLVNAISLGSPNASWNKAIAVVEAHPATSNVTRSSFNNRIPVFAPVLHLWGAYAIAREARGGDAYVFSSEADLPRLGETSRTVLARLRAWRDSLPPGRTGRADGMKMLDVDEYGWFPEVAANPVQVKKTGCS